MTDSNLSEDFLTVDEFAKKLRVHSITIRRAIRNKHISAFRAGSGKRAPYRIPVSEIERMAMFNLEDVLKK